MLHAFALEPLFSRVVSFLCIGPPYKNIKSSGNEVAHVLFTQLAQKNKLPPKLLREARNLESYNFRFLASSSAGSRGP